MERWCYPAVGHIPRTIVVNSIEVDQVSRVGLMVLTFGILSNRRSVGQLNDYILFDEKF
jgi:hypothetical protein